MKHTVFTRIAFLDKQLMHKYLKITKDVLIPCLKSQTCKNFEWVVMIRKEDEEYLKEQLDYPFKPVFTVDEYVKYAYEIQSKIQTRHDCDDWMSPNYIRTIQETFEINIKKYDKFLIQAQPIKQIYHNKKESKLPKYHKNRCSMHLSLCQRNANRHIYEKQHGQMYKVAADVITLNEGFTKWVIHGNNITVLRRKKK